MGMENSIKSKDITILVRGKIGSECKSVLCNIRKLFKDSPIILSTWKNSDTGGLDYDILVESDEPDAKIFNAPEGIVPDENGRINFEINGKKYSHTPKPNNVNRIIKSIQAGLEAVNTEYVLSIRTDIVLKSKNFLSYWDKYPCYDDNYRIFKHRIINDSTYAQFAHVMKKGMQLLPFHMSDWIHFGLTEDVKLLYSCPFQNLEDSAQYWYKHERKQYEPYPDAGWQYPPETYVLYSLVKQKFPQVEFRNSDDYNSENMSFSNRIMANNFIFVNQEDFMFKMKKYPKLHSWECELYDGFITHREWQNLYKTYCDKAYGFTDIDFRRIPFYKRLFNPIYFIKYPGKYIRLIQNLKYVFNKDDLRQKFCIGEEI